MNWLAHLYLSEADAAFRVGSLLPDMVSITELREFPAEVQRGIARHQRVDAYTDAHPVVRQSVARLPAGYRRFGGILLDVFFDHFLARFWHEYSAQSLADFVHEFHASLDTLDVVLPAPVRWRLEQMHAHRVFCSYAELSGIAMALARIDTRLRRPAGLAQAVDILAASYGEFRADFEQFFPQLQRHVREQG